MASSMDEVKAKLGTLISEKRRTATPDNGKNWEEAFLATFEHLERLGIGNDQISEKLNVIHVAGTKGKGSTSAFSESILRHAGYKTGLFTSPHLVNINERIRLNGKPISDEVFAKYFCEVWTRLEETCTPEVGMPGYFRFLTLLGYYVFMKEGVNVAIMEVGLGGRIDSTNVVKRPVVCGIASLGFDHTELLGDTLAKIAREKAGIFKAGVPAYTMIQEGEAMETLQVCAKEVGIDLTLSKELSTYKLPQGEAIKLGILGKHQETNAGLAISLCDTFQARTKESLPSSRYSAVVEDGALTRACLKGLELCSWPGRGQIEKDTPTSEGDAASNLIFYLDGAHTKESMLCCSQWYHAATQTGFEANKSERWLMFNCMKERDPNILFEPLASPENMHFNRAFFVPFVSSTSHLGHTKGGNDFKWQSSLKDIWDKRTSRRQNPLPGNASVGTIGATLDAVRKYAKQNNTKQIHVLVTGSLYLVGDVLRILQRIP